MKKLLFFCFLLLSFLANAQVKSPLGLPNNVVWVRGAFQLGDTVNFAPTGSIAFVGGSVYVKTGGIWVGLGGGGGADSSIFLTKYLATQLYQPIGNYLTTSTGYTQTQIQQFFSGAVPISGYNRDNWNQAYLWGNHAGLYPTIQRFLDSIAAVRGSITTGSGNMNTTVYDVANNGVVDNSEALGGIPASYFPLDSNVVHKAGVETIADAKTFTATHRGVGMTWGVGGSYTNLGYIGNYFDGSYYRGAIGVGNTSTAFKGELRAPIATAARTWNLPDSSGTIALLSNINNIYNIDGILSANRTINANFKNFTLNNANAITLAAEGGGNIVLNNYNSATSTSQTVNLTPTTFLWGTDTIATRAYSRSVGGGGAAGALMATNNLSDLNNVATARTNLGFEPAVRATPLTGLVTTDTSDVLDTDDLKTAIGKLAARINRPFYVDSTLKGIGTQPDPLGVNTANVGGGSVTTDAVPTDASTNPVQSNGVYDALALKADKTALADSMAVARGLSGGTKTPLDFKVGTTTNSPANGSNKVILSGSVGYEVTLKINDREIPNTNYDGIYFTKLADTVFIYGTTFTTADRVHINFFKSVGSVSLPSQSGGSSDQALNISNASPSALTESPANTWSGNNTTGIATKYLPAATDGYIVMDVPVQADANLVAISFDVNNTAYNTIGQLAYSAYIDAGTIMRSNAGTPTSTGITLTAGANTKLKINRSGSTVTVQYTTDGTTWSTAWTFTTTTTAALYPKFNIYGSSGTRKIVNPKGSASLQ